jgi:hypothetical protein
MTGTLIGLLVGRDEAGRLRHFLFAVGLFALTFVAYATGAFVVEENAVFVPIGAIFVGVAGAVVVGFRAGGLVPGWTAAFAGPFGYAAQASLVSDATGGPLGAGLTVEGLFVSAATAVFFGLVAYVFGALIRITWQTLFTSGRGGGSGGDPPEGSEEA